MYESEGKRWFENEDLHKFAASVGVGPHVATGLFGNLLVYARTRTESIKYKTWKDRVAPAVEAESFLAHFSGIDPRQIEQVSQCGKKQTDLFVKWLDSLIGSQSQLPGRTGGVVGGVVPGGEYIMYDGGRYEVLAIGHRVKGVGTKEEVREQVVIYRALYTSAKYGKNAVWDREIGNFRSKVEYDGKQVQRFRFAGMASHS